jgi:hypothetical protein
MTRTVLAVLVLAGLWMPGTVLADSGSCQDPQSDTETQSGGSAGTGPLDIKTVAHSDTTERVTYTLTTWSNFNASDVDYIDWFLNFDANPNIEAVVDVQQQGSGLKGEVLKVSPGPSLQKVADATVTHANGTATLVVDFARQALRDAGLQGDRYGYFVETSRAGSSYQFDDAPDDGFCAHNMTPAGGPSTESRGEVSDSTVTRGQRVEITGGGFAANQSSLPITFTSTPVSLGTTRSDSTGHYSATVTIPTTATPGAHRITVTGQGAQGGSHTSFIDVIVLAAGLPATGGEPSPAGDRPLAVALLLGGSAGVSVAVAVRRRAYRAP